MMTGSLVVKKVVMIRCLQQMSLVASLRCAKVVIDPRDGHFYPRDLCRPANPTRKLKVGLKKGCSWNVVIVAAPSIYVHCFRHAKIYPSKTSRDRRIRGILHKHIKRTNLFVGNAVSKMQSKRTIKKTGNLPNSIPRSYCTKTAHYSTTSSS